MTMRSITWHSRLMSRPSILALVSSILLGSALQAQAVTWVSVRGPDNTHTLLSTERLAGMPRVSGTATAHGKSFKYEGIDLRDVLRAAGVTVDSLRRAHLLRTVILTGMDGYEAMIALTDLDPGIGGRRAILVDREDGQPLSAEYAPRRIIIEGDARPTRWVRQVTHIEVRDLAPPANLMIDRKNPEDKPLLMIDGVLILDLQRDSALASLRGAVIDSVRIHRAGEDAAVRFGSRGRDGVVLIHTRRP